MRDLFCIKNGLVFFEGEFRELDILIEEDRITKIGKRLSGDENYDAKDCIVVPGLIDPHVHLREPGAEYKEDFFTGSRAAVAGGFTTVIDMPNNPIPTVNANRFNEKIALARKKAVCNVLFHFGGTDNNQGEAKKANALSMKIYLGKTTGELFLRKPDSLERHFRAFDGVFVFHASASEGNEREQIKKTVENIMAVGTLKKKYERKCHIAHISSVEELDAAKNFGLSTETAPHYLFLSSKDAEKLGKLGTVYPNLRSEDERRELLANLQRIDCIATDHAPHTMEDKEKGAHGFPGLETSLSLMLKLYWERTLSLEWIINAMSKNVASIFGLNEGEIKIGGNANLSIIDLKKEWRVVGNELYTKCKWSPFEGWLLKGKAKSVFVKGNLVYDDYSFL